MNYWIHRFGLGNVETGDIYLAGIELQAACYLLEERNCLTVGWHGFSDTTDSDYKPNLVNAVERVDFNQVKRLMLAEGISLAWAQSLIRFTKMSVGDIVVVLPYKTDAVDEFFIVEIKSTAKSILNSPATMTQPFTVGGSFDYTFDSSSGWHCSQNVHHRNGRLDVGFFHEVEVLLKHSPRDEMSQRFGYVRSTNSPVKDVSRQRYIYEWIPQRFRSRIPQPK